TPPVGLLIEHYFRLLINYPGAAAVEQGIQIALALFADGIVDLAVHRFIVGRPLDRAEDAERLRELRMAQPAEEERQAGVGRLFVVEDQIVFGNALAY